MKTIGWLDIILYAGLQGTDPIEIGTVRVPLTLNTMRSNIVEASLGQAVEYVSQSLQEVFRNGVGDK